MVTLPAFWLPLELIISVLTSLAESTLISPAMEADVFKFPVVIFPVSVFNCMSPPLVIIFSVLMYFELIIVLSS